MHYGRNSEAQTNKALLIKWSELLFYENWKVMLHYENSIAKRKDRKYVSFVEIVEIIILK